MSTIEQLIRHGMARAFFACAWADQADENGVSLRGEIMQQLPATTDAAAVHAARTLHFDMVRANGGKSLSDLWEEFRTRTGRNLVDTMREETPELFGHYAAMQAMGHGVGLWEYDRRYSFPRDGGDGRTVPFVEFGSYSLERDYFSITG